MYNLLKRRVCYVSLAGFLTVQGFGGATPVQAETKLLFNMFLPPKHSFKIGIFDPWARTVMKESQGRIKVSFTSSSLAPPPKQWNLITKGIADVTMLANAFERNRLILPSVAELPFTTPNAVKSSLAVWKTQQRKFNKANEYKGVKLLGLWTTAPLNILHAKKPISAISDFKNQKMWGFPGIGAAILKSLGAVPVVVPAVRTFNVVSKGVVDGLVIANEALVGFKILRYIKHMTLVPGGVHAVTFSLLMNQKIWDGLSAADKAAVEKASGLNIAKGARATDQRGTKATAAAGKKGVRLIQANPALMADLRKKLAPITARWIKKAAKRGIDGQDAIAFYLSQLK